MEYPSLLARFLDQVNRNPTKAAIIHAGHRLSYSELWGAICRTVHILNDCGIKPGDRVILSLDNSIHYVSAYCAVQAQRAVTVPLNTGLKGEQLRRIVSHTEASLVLRHKAKGNNEVAEYAEAVGIPVVDVALADELAEGDLRPEQFLGNATKDLASIIYTSGTTGRPKGVMLSGVNLAANTSSIVGYLRLTENDTTLCGLPFYYSYGNSVLHTHLSTGATLVLEDSFLYPQKILQTMSTERVTGFSGVPSTYALLLARCDLSSFPLPDLRYLTQAGGAMAPANIGRIRAFWPQAEFFVMYGQTEATARLTYLPPSKLLDKLGTVGIPIPDVEITIRDDAGRQVPSNSHGEICARGPNVMLGYWNDDAATKAKFHGEWLRTGDIGYKDDDGFITIVGRNSDMIKSGAHRIAPEEIEEVIAALDNVVEVAAVGMPDEILGQIVKVYIVTDDGAELDRNVLMRHCKENLAQYKWPKELEYRNSLPKTASGKIKRHELSIH